MIYAVNGLVEYSTPLYPPNPRINLPLCRAPVLPAFFVIHGPPEQRLLYYSVALHQDQGYIIELGGAADVSAQTLQDGGMKIDRGKVAPGTGSV
jgi:hypothetical protein